MVRLDAVVDDIWASARQSIQDSRPKKRLDAVVDYHLGLHARQSIGVEGSEYVEKKSRRLFSTMIILCKMKDESNIYRSINTPH